MQVTIARKAHFNAAHRLHNPQWDDARNREVFGLCNNPNYHGHNYVLIAEVSGEIDPETGYVMDMKVLAQLMDEEVCERFDHKNLNLDTDEFRELIPTAENICVVIWKRLRAKIDTNKQLKVILYETERNYVAYEGVA
jgi:6-pyruvoyltetrahydropterin/6-carboxytetrahydropterin synthase